MVALGRLGTKVVTITLVLFCFTSMSIIVRASAQTSGVVIINTDGSVSGTDLIQRDGNNYRLLADLNFPVVVVCCNVVLDGDGHKIAGNTWWGGPAAINLTASNVTVRNFNIFGWTVGILGSYDNNTIRNNAISTCERAVSIYGNNYVVGANKLEGSTYGIRILNANDSLCAGNSINGNSFAFSINNCTSVQITANEIGSNKQALSIGGNGSSIAIFHNNFYDQNKPIEHGWDRLILNGGNLSQWDRGYPSGGNYYNDYTTFYPNALQIDTSGIGDTPYVVSISRDVSDQYPLLDPVNTSKEAQQILPALAPIVWSSPSIQPTQEATPSPSQTPFLTATESPSNEQTNEPTPTLTYQSTTPATPTPPETPQIQPTAPNQTDQPESFAQELVAYEAAAVVIVIIFVAVAAWLQRQHKTVE